MTFKSFAISTAKFAGVVVGAAALVIVAEKTGTTDKVVGLFNRAA